MSLVHEPLDVIERVRMDPEAVIREVYEAANKLEESSENLRKATKRFESAVNEEGEVEYGIKLLYENAIDNELLAIVDEYERQGKRPPAEDIRIARAKKKIRVDDEALYVAYVQAEMKMHGLRTLISSQKAVISGKQSVLNGLKVLGA